MKASTRKPIPLRTIERLILYRRILRGMESAGVVGVYSHELAERANNTASQVRRDLMLIGYSGVSKRGYLVSRLVTEISKVLDDDSKGNIALVGVGNLGRALLSYFNSRQPQFPVVAAFDADETKVDRVISGCRCHHIREFESKARELDIRLGIITVPAPNAQEVAERMVRAGVEGVLNFAPVPLRLPDQVVTDPLDITLALEKLAYRTKKAKRTT